MTSKKGQDEELSGVLDGTQFHHSDGGRAKQDCVTTEDVAGDDRTESKPGS